MDLPAEGQRAVAPGASVTVLAMLRTEATPGRRQYGVEAELITGEKCTALVTANVYGTYTLTPDPLDFGSIPVAAKVEDPPEREIVFESATDGLRGEPVSDARWLECSIASTNADRTTIRVRLRPEELHFGINSGTVCLPTSSTLRPKACVRVVAIGTRPLTAVPAHVYLAAGERQTVRILDPNGQPARVVQVEGTDSALQAAPRESGEVDVQSALATPTGGPRRVTVRDAFGREGVILVTIIDLARKEAHDGQGK